MCFARNIYIENITCTINLVSNMESRKVQKVGYSTMTVSLPSEWVKQNDISPGDPVFLAPENDGSLRVMPQKVAQKEEAEEYIVNADACHEEGLMERIVIGSYVLGRDVIRISSSHRIRKEQMQEIRRIVPKLIGLGILEETSKNLLLQCSIDVKKFQLDMLIRRLSVLASTILVETLQSLAENNEALAEEAIRREDEADMIYYLTLRLLLVAQKKPSIAAELGLNDPVIIPAGRVLLQDLESIADYGESIAGKVISLGAYKNKLPTQVIDDIHHLGELAHTIFQKATECCFSRDLKVANGLLAMKSVLETESNRLMQELPEIPFLRAIMSDLSKIADKGASIAHLAINLALENPGKQLKDILTIVKHERTLQL